MGCKDPGLNILSAWTFCSLKRLVIFLTAMITMAYPLIHSSPEIISLNLHIGQDWSILSFFVEDFYENFNYSNNVSEHE
jgi:hypothetical protein